MIGRMFVLVAIVSACKSEKAPQARPADPFANIHRLTWSFQPDDVAELVIIAASDSSRETRCDVMSELYARLDPYGQASSPVKHAGIVAIDRPATTHALERMLSDPEQWCYHEAATFRHNDKSGNVSPRQVAAAVLNIYPSPRLQPTLEHAFQDDLSRGGGWKAEIVGLARLSIEREKEMPLSRRDDHLDDVVAAATPQAFERLVDFVGAGLPWNDGAPPATGDQLFWLDAHINQCIWWLHQMVSLVAESPPDKAWPRTREQDLWDAIATGPLGEKIMNAFDHFTTDGRIHLLELIVMTKRRGYRGWLDDIARNDSDELVRERARDELSRSASP